MQALCLRVVFVSLVGVFVLVELEPLFFGGGWWRFSHVVYVSYTKCAHFLSQSFYCHKDEKFCFFTFSVPRSTFDSPMYLLYLRL